jgi:hypothetical protein
MDVAFGGLFKGHSNSLFASSPCNMAGMLIVIVLDHQNEIIRNAELTGDLKTGSGG